MATTLNEIFGKTARERAVTAIALAVGCPAGFFAGQALFLNLL